MTKRELLSTVQLRYGKYAVNDFIKSCLQLSLNHRDYFFDVLTGVVDAFYSDSEDHVSSSLEILRLRSGRSL